MRSRYSKSILFVLSLLFVHNQTQAQLCTGSLGDPVVNITFGAGTNPGKPIAATSYIYSTDPCPSDGYYTIENKFGNCHTDSWFQLSEDHTGDPNGYFMLVNASYTSSDFYVDTVRGLCGSTTYEFAAWVINLMNLNGSVCSNGGIRPNLTFTIEKTNGTVLKSLTTGDIASLASPQWNQYGFFFTTQPNVHDVVIRIRNNAEGGCGNDLALDDITFRPCGPQLSSYIAGGTTTTQEICEGNTDKIALKGSVSTNDDDPTYQWQFSADKGTTWTDIAGATAINYNLSFPADQAPGTYTYRMTYGGNSNITSPTCRSNSNVITIIINPNPVLSINTNSPVCSGTKLTLTGVGSDNYSWKGPNNYTSTTASVVIYEATTTNAGTYTVSSTSDKGCSSSTSKDVVVNPSPTVNAGKDTSLCSGQNAILQGTGSGTYAWTPATELSDATIAKPTATPTATTTYTLQVTNAAGCSASDDVTITINTTPQLIIETNTPVCSGSTLTLTASGADSYSWTGPNNYTATAASLTFKNAATTVSGTYTAIAASTAGCKATASADVLVNQTPTANAGKDAALCSGKSTVLQGSGEGTYTWTPATGLSDATIAQPTATPTATTTYSLLVTSPAGCSASDETTITINSTPQLSIATNSPVCSGQTLTLTGSGDGTYSWAGPNNYTATSTTLTFKNAETTNSGSYTLNSTSAAGCSSSTSVTVLVNQMPVAAAGKNTTICSGESTTLQGSGSGTYTWTPAAGLSNTDIAQPNASPTETTTYNLVVDNQGCSATASVTITVLSLPTANAGADKEIMLGQSVQLDGSVDGSGVKYFWTPTTSMSNNQSLTPVVAPVETITYELHASSDCGVTSDFVTVQVYKAVEVPNAFSPNGDGINDTWNIKALDIHPEANVTVYNRYGSPVYHSIGYPTPWNGTYNGSKLPTGTYYYVIELKDEKTPKLSGWVLILR